MEWAWELAKTSGRFVRGRCQGGQDAATIVIFLLLVIAIASSAAGYKIYDVLVSKLDHNIAVSETTVEKLTELGTRVTTVEGRATTVEVMNSQQEKHIDRIEDRLTTLEATAQRIPIRR